MNEILYFSPPLGGHLRPPALRVEPSLISGKSDVSLAAKKIGPGLIFERLWKQTGIGQAIGKQAAERKFGFDMERAVFLTVLHRLMVSGSDRFCERWHQDYVIDGVAGLELQHLYRAMGFLGERAGGSNPGHGLCPALYQGLHRGGDLFSSP